MHYRKTMAVASVITFILSGFCFASSTQELDSMIEEYREIPDNYDDLKVKYEHLYSDFCDLAEKYQSISELESEPESEDDYADKTIYILNTNSKKIHNPWCSSVDDIASDNYAESEKTIEELESIGYTKCGKKGDWK